MPICDDGKTNQTPNFILRVATLEISDQPTLSLDPGQRLRDVTAMTDRYGNFSIKGIAPGGYKLFAFEEIEIGAYQDPGFLKRLENLGEAVSIREGSRENARIKMIPAGEAAGQNPPGS